MQSRDKSPEKAASNDDRSAATKSSTRLYLSRARIQKGVSRILEDGIALRPVDIDIVYINGYGFPAWRGGPMFYADTMGLKNVLQRIEGFEQAHGPELWEPASLLKKLAAAGKTFHESEIG